MKIFYFLMILSFSGLFGLCSHAQEAQSKKAMCDRLIYRIINVSDELDSVLEELDFERAYFEASGCDSGPSDTVNDLLGLVDYFFPDPGVDCGAIQNDIDELELANSQLDVLLGQLLALYESSCP